MLDVCLLGTGGMMPLPYRWLTSLLVRYNGSSLLIDCGEGTQIAIKEKGWSFKPIDVICFTHYHGDHISGLPGLLLTMGNADRTEPLTLIGPKGLERVVNSLRVIAPELPFQIKYIEITQPEQIFEMNGYRLKAFRVNHNVTCYGYTMEIDRAGKFDVDRANEADTLTILRCKNDFLIIVCEFYFDQFILITQCNCGKSCLSYIHVLAKRCLLHKTFLCCHDQIILVAVVINRDYSSNLLARH